MGGGHNISRGVGDVASRLAAVRNAERRAAARERTGGEAAGGGSPIGTPGVRARTVVVEPVQAPGSTLALIAAQPTLYERLIGDTDVPPPTIVGRDRPPPPWPGPELSVPGPLGYDSSARDRWVGPDDALLDRLPEADRLVLEGGADAASTSSDDGTRVPGGAALTDRQVTDTLSLLGFELPYGPPDPRTLAVGRDLLDAMPADVRGLLFAEGVSIGLELPGWSAATPGFLPVGGGTGVSMTVATELGERAVGVDFAETRTLSFEAAVTFDASARAGRGSTGGLFKVLEWIDRHGRSVPGMDSLNRLRSATNLPVGIEVERSVGLRLGYEAVVTPEEAALIDQGESIGPNPFDPLAMTDGTSVIFRTAAVRTEDVAVTYKMLLAEGSVTEVDGHGYGVTRLDGDRVAVYSGPLEAVESTVYVGFGKGFLSVGLGNDIDVESMDLAYAEIDLGTADGRAHYERFVQDGVVPSASTDGVRAGTRTISAYDRELALELRTSVGDFGLSLDESTAAFTYTRFDDGEMWAEFTATRDGFTSHATYRYDADGNYLPDESVYTFVVANADDRDLRFAATWMDPWSGDPTTLRERFGDDVHMQFTLTADQLMELRDRARGVMIDTHELDPDVYERNGDVDSFSDDVPVSNVLGGIATASTPDEVADLIMRGGTGNFETLDDLVEVDDEWRAVSAEFEFASAG